MPDISIFIVAYNPDRKLFTRCLKAVAALKRGSLDVEYLLIDNNSNPSLSTYQEVRDFLAACPGARILVETRQGSGYARLCGFRAAAAPLIVTFDDDNEPEENYLLNAKDFADRNPAMGVLGPGIIKVDYTDGAPPYFKKFGYVFQETNLEEEMVTDAIWPNTAYPYGTGMVVRKEVAIDYCNKAEEGKLNSIGRIGAILTCGEDMQLIWNNIRNLKLSVGKSPAIQLNHLINGRKANFQYWKRLSYGGGFSWASTRFEVFPEELHTVKNTNRELRKSFLRICKVFVYNFYKPRFFIISMASQVGILEGIYYVNKKKIPFFLNWTRILLGLKK